jgi:hypothetical protein
MEPVHRRGVKKVLKAVVGLAALAIAALAVAFAAFVSEFGDRSPVTVITRNESSEPVVAFLCDDARPLRDCRGRRVPARATTMDNLGDVGHGEDAFTGDIIITNETCGVLSRTTHSGRGDAVVVIGSDGVEFRTGISPAGERYASGFEVLEWSPRDVSCPLDPG